MIIEINIYHLWEISHYAMSKDLNKSNIKTLYTSLKEPTVLHRLHRHILMYCSVRMFSDGWGSYLHSEGIQQPGVPSVMRWHRIHSETEISLCSHSEMLTLYEILRNTGNLIRWNIKFLTTMYIKLTFLDKFRVSQ